MNTRRLLIALAVAGAGIGAAQAATHPPQPAASTTATKATAAPAHRTRHLAPKSTAAAMDRAHQRVALAREAEQRRWIEAELQSGRLGRAQAASLWNAASDLAHDQVLLTGRGHETFDEALALSHRQDVLDWAVRSGEIGYEPQALRTLG